MQIRKEEAHLSQDMILYIEKSKACNKTLLEVINKLSKVLGYQRNIQISVSFIKLQR
jgi:nickel-dependent lactate racemase